MFQKVEYADPRETDGFHLLTRVSTNYEALVAKLGEPNDKPDRWKMTAAWCVRFGADVFTVYDYKPEHGLPAGTVRSSRDLEWHIGGKDPRSLDRFVEFLSNSPAV